jgi:hypothetical protein
VPDTPASPKADRLTVPSWLDTRLVLGILLVLVSVVVGAKVLSSADRSATVFAAVRDLEPGATLHDGDLVAQEVRLDPAQVRRLVPVPADGRPPSGYVALRGITAGDLLLRSALVDERGTDLRQFTLNVEPGHAPPDLRGNQLVDVYVTPEVAGGAPLATGASPSPGRALSGPGSRLVLAAVAVASAPVAGGFSGRQDQAVVLNVAPRDVLTLVRAVAEGEVDLVRQLGGRPAPAAVPTAGPAATAAAG